MRPGLALIVGFNCSGFQAINDSSKAANFTVAQFINVKMRLPSSSVSYTVGLVNWPLASLFSLSSFIVSMISAE